MKFYNEKGIVWNCLTKEEQDEMIEASEKKGATTYFMCYDGWNERKKSLFETDPHAEFAYKVEVPDRVREYMTVSELWGKTLVNEKGRALILNSAVSGQIHFWDGDLLKVEELSEKGLQLQPSGKPEFEGSVPLFREVEA